MADMLFPSKLLEFRVANIEDVDPDALAMLYVDLRAWGDMTPISHLITDYEVDGSYARKCAKLPSDLDINIATDTEENRLLARKILQENQEQMQPAIYFYRQLCLKYGMRLNIHLQHPTIKTISAKCCYSLRDMKKYGTELRRTDVNWQTGEVTFRPVPPIVHEPHHSIAVEDPETGNWREYNPDTDTPEMYDRDHHRIPQVEGRYRAKLLKFGETPETRWMKRKWQ